MSRVLFWNHSIKARATIFTLIILVLSLWLLSFSTSRILRADMERALGEQQASTASLLAGHVDRDLRDRITTLELIARSINSSLLAKPASLQKLLEERLFVQVQFNGGIFAAGADGTAIADFPVVAGRVGTNYMDRDTVALPLKEGKTVIGRPNMGKTLKAPIFSIAVPIRGDKGQVIGVLVGTVDLGKPNFLESVGAGRYGKSGGYLIVAPQHKLFVTASNYKSLVMQPIPAQGINRVLDRRLAEGFDEPAVNINSLGVEVLASSARIPAAGWILIATLPTAEAFAPIRNVERNLLESTLFLTVLASGLVWWMLRRQLAPMLDTAKALAGLSLAEAIPPPLPIVRQDEIGDLVRSFNGLLESLSKRESELRLESEKNHALLRHASDGIHILDANGNLIEFSDSFCEMLGYRRDELLGANVALWDAQMPEQELKDVVTRQIASKKRSLFTTRHRRRDGSVIDVEVTGQGLLLNNKPALFNASRDISDRVRIETKLRTLSRSVEQSPVSILICDAEGNIEYVNPFFTTTTGYAASEVIGKNPRILQSKNMSQDFYRNLWKTIKSGYVWSGEIQNTKKSGELFWESATISPIFDDDGSITQFIGIKDDITERKQHEETLRALNNDLERRIAERTRDLAVANEELGSFSYTVAHDLRAPVRAINGYAEMVLESSAGKLEPTAEDYLRRVVAGSRRMGTLIDDLLNLARLSRQEMKRQDFNLGQVAASIVDSLSSAHPGRDVTIAVAPDLKINGDQGLLGAVLENLIGNAWKFTSKTPLARIEVGSAQRANEHVYFVRDNGVGFDMKYAHKLFSPFQRLHKRDDFEGTGIGLATVRKIIERHGGRVWIESAVNAGTTVYFTIGASA